MPNLVTRSFLKWPADPPWPLEWSLLGSLGLSAYAIYDAFQPVGTPSPVSFAWEVGLPLADKWVHLCGYGAVALLGLQALVPPVAEVNSPPRGLSGRLSAVLHRVAPKPLLAAIVVSGYATMVAVGTEMIQAVMGLGRSGELQDVLVSLCGIGLAAVGFLLSRTLRRLV